MSGLGMATKAQADRVFNGVQSSVSLLDDVMHVDTASGNFMADATPAM
jgi:hypothetical protein